MPRTRVDVSRLPRQPVTLAESMGEVADDLRQLYTDFGLAADRVFLLVYRWTGDEVGAGEPERVLERELDPRPIVEGEVRWGLDAGGGNDKGTVRLVGVSPRSMISDLFGPELDVPAGHEVFFELVPDGRDGDQLPRRLFRPNGVPKRRTEQFDLAVSLTKCEDDRIADKRRRDWAAE